MIISGKSCLSTWKGIDRLPLLNFLLFASVPFLSSGSDV